MSDTKAKRFQAMILAEFERSQEIEPDTHPDYRSAAWVQVNFDDAKKAMRHDKPLEACRAMIKVGAMALRFLCDSDPLLSEAEKVNILSEGNNNG